MPLERKEVDDVMGGTDAWKDVDQTEIQCPNNQPTKCTSNQAYFRTVQTRGGDEPTTAFYRCIKCSHNWNEN